MSQTKTLDEYERKQLRFEVTEDIYSLVMAHWADPKKHSAQALVSILSELRDRMAALDSSLAELEREGKLE